MPIHPLRVCRALAPALIFLIGSPTVRAEPEGAELIGKPFVPLDGARWPGENVKPPSYADAPLTMIRWWTDACPYCEVSLPALAELERRFAPRGLRLIAMYHPKPPRKVRDSDVLEAAKRIGFEGRIGVDEDWSLLRRGWLQGKDRRATSATIVVDRQGIVRYVHPGPLLARSSDPSLRQANADLAALEHFLDAWLGPEPDS